MVPNGTTFADLERPLTPISRSRHFSTLSISDTARDRAIVTIERQYEVISALSHGDIPMTLSDPQPGLHYILGS